MQMKYEQRGIVVATLKLASLARSVYSDLVAIISSNGNKHFNTALVLIRGCNRDSSPAVRAVDLYGKDVTTVTLCICLVCTGKADLLQASY